MKVQLEPKTLRYEPISVDSGVLPQEIVRIWGAREGCLLGHAFDGVLWGLLQQGSLTTAHGAGHVGADIDPNTLLEVLVFDDTEQLRVWRQNGTLLGCRVTEVGGQVPSTAAGSPDKRDFAAWGDEEYQLLGSPKPGQSQGGFATRVGRGGQRHAPPAQADRLRVRHYFARDDATGLLREAAHRILGITQGA